MTRMQELDALIAAGRGDQRLQVMTRTELREMDMRHRQALTRAQRFVLPPRIQRMVLQLCRAYGIVPAEVLGGSRTKTREAVDVRREVARMLRTEGWSYPRIGRLLGAMHHTSVLHLLRSEGRATKKKPPAYDSGVPDLSGEWAI